MPTKCTFEMICIEIPVAWLYIIIVIPAARVDVVMSISAYFVSFILFLIQPKVQQEYSWLAYVGLYVWKMEGAVEGEGFTCKINKNANVLCMY